MNLISLRALPLLACVALSLVASPASADVAVMLQITSAEVSVQRIERSEPTEMDLSDAAIKLQSVELGSEPDLVNEPPDEHDMTIEWLDASGAVVHRETRQDPRFLHDPDGHGVVMPEAVLLLRGPTAAVQLRVMPSGFAYFLDFSV